MAAMDGGRDDAVVNFSRGFAKTSATGIMSAAPRALTFTISSHSSSLYRPRVRTVTSKALAYSRTLLCDPSISQSLRRNTPHSYLVAQYRQNSSQSLLILFLREPTVLYIKPPKPLSPSKMLRRQPTTIQLTQADLERYEANRQRKLWEQQQQQQAKPSQSSQSSQGSEKVQQVQQLPQKSKKDRVMGAS